jgi:hypothetical protein
VPNLNVITAEDREYLDPVLGGTFMRELLERDRSLWEKTGDLIVAGFKAGKQAECSRWEVEGAWPHPGCYF